MAPCFLFSGVTMFRFCVPLFVFLLTSGLNVSFGIAVLRPSAREYVAEHMPNVAEHINFFCHV